MIVYKCDACGRVVETVCTGGSFPVGGAHGASDEAVYISWKIEPRGSQGQIESHLCRTCLREAFLQHGAAQ